MDIVELFQRLGVALAIGLLIGLERGWQEREGPDGSRTAGIRTYSLIGLLGGLWAAMLPMLGPIPLAAAGVAFAGAFTLFEWRETASRGEFSITSTVAGFIVFALGAFAVLGSMTVASAAGAATLGLLASRKNLHEFLKKLTWPELRSAVFLLGMTFLLLPILPDRTIDPWNTFNPHELWLMTVLIGAVSFMGYIAVRVMGVQRGLVLASIAGALVSSTTVTLNNSRLAAEHRGEENPMLALAICTAWATSLTRMTVVATVVNPAMLGALALPIASGLGVLALAIAYFYFRAGDKKVRSDLSFDNPLDIIFVLKFGALLAVVVIGVALLGAAFGQAGVLGLAGVSGFADVDPITLSASQAAGMTITPADAARAILLAAGTNLLTKIALPVVIGGWRFGVKLAIVGTLVIGTGGFVLLAHGA